MTLKCQTVDEVTVTDYKSCPLSQNAKVLRADLKFENCIKSLKKISQQHSCIKDKIKMKVFEFYVPTSQLKVRLCKYFSQIVLQCLL